MTVPDRPTAFQPTGLHYIPGPEQAYRRLSVRVRASGQRLAAGRGRLRTQRSRPKRAEAPGDAKRPAMGKKGSEGSGAVASPKVPDEGTTSLALTHLPFDDGLPEEICNLLGNAESDAKAVKVRVRQLARGISRSMHAGVPI